MDIDLRTLALIKQRMAEAERNIQYVQQILGEGEEKFDVSPTSPRLRWADPAESGSDRVVEGVFDGQKMQYGDGEEYPVPANYASKSRLVEGDCLKLTISSDGSFTYKQIGPVDRRRVVGKLVVDEQGIFGVETSEAVYKVLLASVTFYHIKEGDDITILLPEKGEATWGAIEHVMNVPSDAAVDLVSSY